MADVPALVGAAFNDVLSMFSIPGANLTGELARSAVASYLRRQSKAARDILLEEFRLGNIDRIELANEDELGGILFRYFNAIRDNAARLNLRLMAKVMVGQAQRDMLYVDDFSKYSNCLTGLSKEEIIAISKNYAYTESIKNNKIEGFLDPRNDNIVDGLVPSIFKSEEHLLSVCSAASRSGLLMISLDMNTFRFLSTPIMDEVAKLADFQDALRRESADIHPQMD